MFVSNAGDNADTHGLLRLHSTYRHDLKCYTSDEGRCQKTAAAFLKGLLEFDGALAPILAIMVQNDDSTNSMLDDSSKAQELLSDLSDKLKELLHYDNDDLLSYFIEKYGEPAEVVI